MKKIIVLFAIILFLTACNSGDENIEVSKDFFAMDTYMSLSATSVSPETALDESYHMILEIENLISRTNEESDIYRLNQSNGAVVVVSDLTYEILSIAVECAEKTEGAFDPTICAITDLWGIGTEEAAVPTEEEIGLALETVSYENIVLLGENQVQLLNGAQVALGARGKGYAADQVVEIYEENEILYGVISLSGNVYVYGEKVDGSLWNIGITDPDDTSEISITLQTQQTSIVTTGAYERYFEEDGIIYHHIFDAETGYPCETDIKSVTVISENSTIADIYATALFVMGYEEAIAFAQGIEEMSVIIVNEKDEVYVSDAVKDYVILGEKYEDSGY